MPDDFCLNFATTSAPNNTVIMTMAVEIENSGNTKDGALVVASSWPFKIICCPLLKLTPTFDGSLYTETVNWMGCPRSAAGMTKTSCPSNRLLLLTDGSVLITEPRGVPVELSKASPTAYNWPPENEQSAETGIVTSRFEYGFEVVVT